MQPEPTTLPTAAIIICSKDRHAGLLTAVDHVRRLEYPRDRYEVIVVEEEGSQAGPVAGVRYVAIPRKHLGLGYARNVGVSHVDLNRVDLVAFCDDDEVPDPRWLREIVRPFQDPAVYGAGGLVRCQESSAWLETQELLGIPGSGLRRLADESADAIVPTVVLSGSNHAYRSAVFREFRYPEDTKILRGQGEDFFMACEVGGKYALAFNPKAIMYHEPRATVARLWKTYFARQKRDYLARHYFMGHGRFEALFWKGHRLLLFRSAAACALVVGLGWPGAAALVLLYYGGALLSVRRLYRFVRRKATFFLYPFAKLAADLGVLAGEVVCLGQLRAGAPPMKLSRDKTGRG
ncbi:MAG: glycosyltransferase [Nitrospirae bacterium]|nr:glycosyltransferase [Nitrospirota bacterium]